ncbi:dipeptide epimerase [Mesorhizobium sp. M0114]|uniref:N-acetyl-D-Glu racemase DgcA n=1 Tax=unclassified Mesorhizobium TaxID=325217 RepID=UPI00333B9079
MRGLSVAVERWPIAGTFTIARGSRTEAVVVVASVTENEIAGRGECVPYARYGETVDVVVQVIRAAAHAIAQGATREEILRLMPAGAARNAIDCALWDLEAKLAGRRFWQLIGMPDPQPMVTCYTLSVGTPEPMYEAARAAAHLPLLKVKLAGPGDPERIAAVREGAPRARLVVDANEAWTPETFADNMRACLMAGVELIEQPLPVGEDEALLNLPGDLPLCADESLHTAADLPRIANLYQAVNIKLDKTGGLTEAFRVAEAAEAARLQIMVGCMLGTSLAMAPATLVAQRASVVDLDGPLLLARDREPGLTYTGGTVAPPTAQLWG